MALHFFDTFFNEVDGRLAVFVQDKASAIMTSITPVVMTLLGLYIVMWGLSIAYGKVKEPIADGVWRIIRVMAILGIGLNLGYYNHYVTDWVTGLPADLTKVIAYAAGSTSYETSGDSISALDIAFDAGWKSGKEFWTSGDLFDVGPLILAVVVWLATFILTGYAAFLLVLAKIATAVLLAIGPIYVMLLLFQKTEKFFDSWVSQVVNFIVLQVIAVGMLSLILDIFQGAATGLSSDEMAMDQVAFCVVTGLLGILVMMQATTIAAGISGGAALATQGAFGMAMKMMGRQSARAVNNSPVGVRFMRGQEHRAAYRQHVARVSAREKYDARTSSRDRRRDPPPNSPAGGGGSAATSGAQNLSAMRARAAGTSDASARNGITGRDPRRS